MTKSEKLLVTVNIAAVAFVLVATLRPGGSIRDGVSQWLRDRSIRHTLSSDWTGITSTGGRLDRGNGNVRLLVFSDYQCPFCRVTHYALDSLTHQDPSIGLVYRHFPLPIHPAAPGAARASICADAQGRFRELDEELFSTTAWEADTNWTREAHAAGVPDLKAFATCLASPETVARLNADLALGQKLGIAATPTLFVKGGLHTGAMTVQELRLFIGLGR